MEQRQHHLEQASLLSQQGRWAEAVQLYDRYLATAGADDPGLPACHRGTGWCYQQLGNHRKALSHLIQSLRHGRRRGPPIEVARAYNVLAGILFYLERPRQSRNALDRLLRLAAELGDTQLTLQAHLNLSRWELTYGRPAAAGAALEAVRPLLIGAAPEAYPREQVWWLILRSRTAAALGERGVALALAHGALPRTGGFFDAAAMRQEIAQLFRALQI